LMYRLNSSTCSASRCYQYQTTPISNRWDRKNNNFFNKYNCYYLIK
jgi:hypothetical protein